MRKESWPARCIRCLYELSLSLYYVLLLSVNTSTFGNFEMRVRRLPPALLRLTNHLYWSNPVESIEYLTWFLMAGIVFVILRILGQIRPLRTVLCQLVGSAVFLVPLVRMMTPFGATMPGWWMWLWVEGTVASAAALLYANRTRPATAVFLAVTSLLHFGLWSFVYFRGVRLVGVVETIAELVLLPLFGTLAWASYVWLLPRPTRHE